ncbi:hypothetical protein BS47DRAFT_1295012 [Hydnum rufescens UP504]|uniref:CTLH domain-containing protein n=1 Tax=Hydnum rufescens UP504 TaxID=1448309 RepID=A0A9P6AZ17_9AGAM|nr:hypothetical protein BS47DRAFT_1295012 [Hydnum rufescens UP504]
MTNSSPLSSFPSATNGSRQGYGHIYNNLLHGVARVHPPGTTMYKDSNIHRDEYVRLVLQSLRDVGYLQTAAVLEAESGYVFESDMVAQFRQSVLQGQWDAVEQVLEDMGVHGDDQLRTAYFLIRQQKYLESLEQRRSDTALQILRNELAPLSFDSDRLHLLSRPVLMMCTSTEDLMRRAQWSGAMGESRHDLLVELQRTIPPSVMIPSRRLESLLNQAQEAQQRSCLYHNTQAPFSLYTDHSCGKSLFPSITTNVLAEHDDEVWTIEWSRDGRFLASGGKDRAVIIWRVGASVANAGRECHVERVIRDHESEIGALAWSWDGSTLLSSADRTVKMWNVKTGVCIKEITDHGRVVTCIKWLPDQGGFVTSAMDSNIFFYDNLGSRIDSRSLPKAPLRVVDFSISPDGQYLVAVGQPNEGQAQGPTPLFDLPLGVYSTLGDDLRSKRTQLVIFDLENKTTRASQIRIGDMTSVKISPDSRFALINYAPNVGLIKVVFLWDMQTSQLVRRFLGHQHEQHVLRSSFGGVNDTWVVSGGEDQLIYVWHRDTAEILETLDGHKHGSVNSVSWNPVDDGVFASCSDDGTIRVWEAPTWTSTGDSIADSSASSHSSGLHAKALYGIRTNGSNDRAASPNWH